MGGSVSVPTWVFTVMSTLLTLLVPVLVAFMTSWVGLKHRVKGLEKHDQEHCDELGDLRNAIGNHGDRLTVIETREETIHELTPPPRAIPRHIHREATQRDRVRGRREGDDDDDDKT